MGIATNVWSRFCYIKCDQPPCTNKIDSDSVESLPIVAKLCGWKNTDDQWICPTCSGRKVAPKGPKITPKARKSAGIVTNLWGKFGYVKCDRPNCNRKLNFPNLKTLEQVAPLTKWKNTGDRWTCPDCVKKEEIQRKSKRYK